MTWLELMEALDEMPLHLLKHEIELWRYESFGHIEVMPVHHLVNPHDDEGDPEWEKGGNYYLSLQSFADGPKSFVEEPDPKKFYVDVAMCPSVQLCIQADSESDALGKAGRLVKSKEFFDSIKDDFDFDEWELFDTMLVTATNECFDNVEPIYVDGFIG